MVDQHNKLEAKLVAAKEKVLRLQKQKRMWLDKVIRAVRRGIDSVEELVRVKREEAEQVAIQAAPDPLSLSASGLSPLSLGKADPGVNPNLNLLALLQPGVSADTPVKPPGSSQIELEEAEEKVLRLRKQKRTWLEKMMRAIRRGINRVEELELGGPAPLSLAKARLLLREVAEAGLRTLSAGAAGVDTTGNGPALLAPGTNGSVVIVVAIVK
ncbi:hypothetical protein GGTG_14278 [Gaeumannomyces tritici R3-111a-1]|uniref:Uncharacterized protein n=1 Tax=Gaeumannomyces tritici (strain R3-111a-1) TaxID=644352 RepID=J3PL34_GAET3|nr:hypothetical protein GGTG_14278 [Gaeumannomyces tritici R3-111a-1]EJT68143.1 hypothetical protein GGTG_14278 [Gaeumannomyces tritici R3-111a-1]